MTVLFSGILDQFHLVFDILFGFHCILSFRDLVGSMNLIKKISFIYPKVIEIIRPFGFNLM